MDIDGLKMAHFYSFNSSSDSGILNASQQHSNPDSSSDSSDGETTIIPLKNIVIPPSFLLPSFTPKPSVKPNLLDIDIFKTDNRSIEKIWLDIIRSHIRDSCQKQIRPDGYVLYIIFVLYSFCHQMLQSLHFQQKVHKKYSEIK